MSTEPDLKKCSQVHLSVRFTFLAKQLRLLWMLSLGGMLEAYDFIIYGLMVVYISPLFFPVAEPQVSLLMAFATFSVGYLSRPLGGVLFGHQGDRRGRKKTLTATLLLMALVTVSIGCLPTFSQIGIMAPCLLILLRFCQGLSIGGEVGGVYTYISEVFDTQKGLAVGIMASGMKLGMLLGQGVHALLLTLLNHHGMMAFGWRIPFWLGGLLAIAGYFIRRQSLESEAFKQIKRLGLTARLPLLELRHHRGQCLCGTLLVLMLSVSYLTFLIYIPNILMTTKHPSGTPILSGLMLLTTIISNITLGCLMGRHSRYLLILAATSLTFIGPVLIWLLFSVSSLVIPTMILCGLLTSLACVPGLYFLCSLFPMSVRYTGISLTYGIGFAMGGLTPTIASWLCSLSSPQWAASSLLIVSGISGFIASRLPGMPAHSPDT